jgi:excisionase family DNA binding protein
VGDRILRTNAAAKLLGVSKKTLLRFCHQRLITYMLYPDGYRFRESALQIWMQSRTMKAAY